MNTRAPLVLSVGILIALLLGTAIPPNQATLYFVVAFLFFATLGTVGGLEKGWHTRASNYRGALSLLVINIIAGSLPMLFVGLWIGPNTSAGLGFILLSIVPVAAGIPAYTAALGVPAERITLFALISYVIALVATPIFMGIATGETLSQGSLWITLFVGLILPSIFGIVLARPIARIPVTLRQVIIFGSLLAGMLGIGSSLSFRDLNISALGVPLMVVILLGLIRAPMCAFFGLLLNRVPSLRTSPREAMLAGGYKNGTLAGVAAIAIGNPAAALPGVLGFVSEAILVALLAFRAMHQKKTSRDSGLHNN